MGKYLVIVESPAKAKTINKILGSDCIVKSSIGHVRDLPQSILGVDIQNGFKPTYVVSKGKKKVIDDLREAARKCDRVYLAPDPDREGEAIAWHLQQILSKVKKPEDFLRVQYNEITPEAVRHAFENPGQINQSRVDAQQARRILDRIVGYMVSPLLWRRIQRGLSAGRVQSVALRLLCEREREIQGFVPVPYWVLGAVVRKEVDPLDPFRIRLIRVDGKKVDVRTPEEAERIWEDLKSRTLRVMDVSTREISKRAPPPFITSTLQQAASNECNFSPKRTMQIAQKLYEGVELPEGPVGLITYMRTDSFAVSQQAVEACREYITERLGAEYCPDRQNQYRSRDGAQEAHEAIRPTDVRRTPESMAARLDPAALRLYELIWRRFVASQMAPARLAHRLVSIEAVASTAAAPGSYLFQATTTEVKFPGYMQMSGSERVKPVSKEDEATAEKYLPPLVSGEALTCIEWLSERKETKPPARYSEASLIKALETNGVGRPSTYAQIISTLHQREYAVTDRKSLSPTPIGFSVCDLLVANLNQLFDVGFTASMEKALDEVEQGKVDWTRMLGDFYQQFEQWMGQIQTQNADSSAVASFAKVFTHVKDWAPPVKRGKRTYSDEKFVTSINELLESGKKPVTTRQFEAMVKIASRYRKQVPEIEAVLADPQFAAVIQQQNGAPCAATLRKLEILAKLTMSENTTNFVDSLRQRADSGRQLTDAQIRALDNVLLSNADKIAGFDEVAKELGLVRPQGRPEDIDCLLKALGPVKEWKDPVKRGKRVFDDQQFYQSLQTQFASRNFLTDRQTMALKNLVRRYRAQIPEYEKLAETYGLLRKSDKVDLEGNSDNEGAENEPDDGSK